MGAKTNLNLKHTEITEQDYGYEDFIESGFECPVVTKYNGGLTKKEVEEGYIIDSVLGKCNPSKALKERREAIQNEIESFDRMHTIDGILGKSVCSCKL